MSDHEWVELACFPAPPGSRDKSIEFYRRRDEVSVETGCCGCSTPLTAEQMDALVEAWQSR
jgi:hypothetical protein